ncbi:MAG: NUDIX hydrolase [Eubacteriales bacterium]
MPQYNIIIAFSPERDRVLMCRRKKPPYAGMLNFVGGHIEAGKDHENAAYRELYEETGIGRELIRLVNVMNLSYPRETDILCEVWAGKLCRDLTVSRDENPLIWVSTDSDFSDVSRFAGEGNIYHMMKYIEIYWEQIFGDHKIVP